MARPRRSKSMLKAAFALYFSVLSAWLQGFSSTEGAVASLRDLLGLLVRGLGAPERAKRPKETPEKTKRRDKKPKARPAG